MNDFVHLNVHSEYSIEDSIVRIDQLVSAVKERGMSAVALTDKHRLTAMLKFQTACFENGIKPIIGCDLDVSTDLGEARATFLCADQTGYHNLIRLITAAARDANSKGQVTLQMLKDYQQGLMLLSGSVHGVLGESVLKESTEAVESLIDQYLQIFGDRFYASISRTGRLKENAFIERVVPIADRKGVPLVATNDVICLNADDFSIHDAKLCIQRNESMDDEYSWQGEFSDLQHLRSPREMAELFEDVPDAIENTHEIAKRCNVEVETGTYFQRPFPAEDMAENGNILREKVAEALQEFLDDPNNEVAATSREEYQNRVDYELDVIIEMGFASYFLIVQKIVLWAKSQNIPVGPGRGSGAASLVARVLGITGVDPIKHKLFFERLLNRDRRSMPDLDIDFCAERRGEVMWHVVEQFGRDCVGLIATCNTHAAKGALNGMGRAMGIPYTDMRKITKLIPQKLGTKLEEAVNEDPEIAKTALRLGNADLIPQTLRLEGTVSNTGIHPAGVVIAPARLEEYVPCYVDKDTQLLVSHLDKDDVEKAGLVKFDLLNLKYLTVIDNALKSINSVSDVEAEPIKPETIPFDDVATFKLIRRAETEGIFQLESPGMKNLIRNLKPDEFADIVALIALFRPGPLNAGTDQHYANRKNKLEPVSFAHKLLEPVLNDTHGLMIYQEDVMRVARTLAGFSGSEADILREAMGKKRMEVLAQLKDRFLEGCNSNGIEQRLAEATFEDMLGFSEYAFARAHATAYAMVTYQTAYLKANYPREYMAAAISVERSDPNRLVRMLVETDRMGLTIAPPDINNPSANCVPTPDGIRLGLLCLKGWKDPEDINILKQLIEAEGKFSSCFELCVRVPLARFNKNKLANLILAGAFDEVESHYESKFIGRKVLHDKLERSFQAGLEMSSGRGGVFGRPNEDEVFSDYKLPEPFTENELCAGEVDALGFAPSQKSTAQYITEFAPICSHSLSEIQGLQKGTEVVMAGVITRAEIRDGNRGEYAQVDLSTDEGVINVVVWPEAFEKYSRYVMEDTFAVVEGRIDRYRDRVQIASQKLLDVESARRQFKSFVSLRFDKSALRERLTEQNLARFKELFKKTDRQQGRPVEILVRKGPAMLRISLGKGFKKLNVTDEVLAELNDIFGSGVVNVGYQNNPA